MGRTALTVQPYVYPSDKHVRLHGPAGYTDYKRYRPWLEDEFGFRCVFCLKRMVWAPTDVWTVDHVVPQSAVPELLCEYDNLVFACQFCNSQKGPNRIPDPGTVGYGTCLKVEPDGTVTPLNRHGRRLVTVFRLNHAFQVQERSKILRILSVLARSDQAEFTRLMGYPLNLPDIERLRPPTNRKPNSHLQCHFARRQRGELPAVY